MTRIGLRSSLGAFCNVRKSQFLFNSFHYSRWRWQKLGCFEELDSTTGQVAKLHLVQLRKALQFLWNRKSCQLHMAITQSGLGWSPTFRFLPTSTYNRELGKQVRPWMHFLQDLEDRNMGHTWYSRVSYHFAPLPYNMTIEDAGRQLITFVFVRHPFARFVSSYQDKIVAAKTQKCKNSKLWQLFPCPLSSENKRKIRKSHGQQHGFQLSFRKSPKFLAANKEPFSL